MYMEDLCTIKKTDDGKFVVQVMPPRKKEAAKGGKEPATVMMEDPKTYVAADEGELIDLIKEYVTSRGKKKTADEKFEKGYKSK